MSSDSLSSHTSVSGFVPASLLVVTVLAGGCMKIYPDPDLPDIVTRWEAENSCVGVTRDIHLSVVDRDNTRVIAEQDVPCSALGYRFEDIPREQVRLMGDVLDSNDGIRTRWQREVDLRSGIGERVDMSFGISSTFRIAWTFENGTCDSYGADVVAMEEDVGISGVNYKFEDSCHLTPYFTWLPSGNHRIRLRARHNSDIESRVVAESPFLDVTILSDQQVTDVGTLVLSPCTDCPN